MEEEEVKKVVRKGYARIAKQKTTCCGPTGTCGSVDYQKDISKTIGYTDEELRAVPEGSNLGLGCGNPIALASLKEGEIVLDLGSGAGFDCFLASQKVGPGGKVIGVDMTPEMIDKARANAKTGPYENVEFRLGEIENLPAADNSVDVIISNCVINLSPSKDRVFREALRVLKPGGRFLVSDIVLLQELPDPIKKSVESYIGCLSGAIMKEKYIQAIKAAGFQKVEILEETHFPIDLMANDPTAKALLNDLKTTGEEMKEVAGSAVSIKISATKKLS